MRRIERLINLIAALLETSHPMTSEEIRSRIAGYDQESIEAFRRAFERDKEALRTMGIPLETRSTGPFGDEPDGYVIPKDKYYLPELDLEPDELAALRIAAGAVLGASTQAESGLMKLSVDTAVGAGVGAPGAGPPGAPRLVWGADLAAEQPLLGPAFAAVSERRVATFEYERPDGERRARTVEPYGLVYRRGNWYLVGRDRERDAVRGFKLSRVHGAIRTVEETFTVPGDFDARAHVSREAWEIGTEENVVATVRFSPRLRWWAEQNVTARDRSEGPNGSLDVELEVANVNALVSWVVGFAGEAEVVEPEPLRRAVTEHLAVFMEPTHG